MQALQKLEEGQKFHDVASQYSEDKARYGVHIPMLRTIS